MYCEDLSELKDCNYGKVREFKGRSEACTELFVVDQEDIFIVKILPLVIARGGTQSKPPFITEDSAMTMTVQQDTGKNL